MQTLPELVHEVLEQPGFSAPLLLVGAVMYGAWTAAYVCIIRSCFKDRSYGVPFVCLCFNVIWELCFSTMVLYQGLHWFFKWGNALWFIFDLIIAYQFFKYGREVQVNPFIKRYFYTIAIVTLVLCGTGLSMFTFFFNEYTGAASSMMMNFVMSILYIFMVFSRPDLRGLSYAAAWLKMIGTLGGSILLYFWFPAQFKQGYLLNHPEVLPPQGYGFMHYLYVSIFFFDCVYIYLLTVRRRELREQISGSTLVTQPATAA